MKDNLPPLLVKLKLAKKVVPLSDMEPLDLPQKGSTGLQSFKEMWRCDSAYTTLEACKVYEAGGSLMWVSPLETKVPCTPFSFSQVKELGQLFQEDPDLKRIIYPSTVQCYLESHTDLKPDQCPSALALVDGSGLVMSWWCEVFFAMQNNDWDRVTLLWQCALTITIRLRVSCPLQDLTLQALQNSEALKTQGRLVADSLTTFTARLQILTSAIGEKTIPKRLSKLIDLKVAFNGSLINRQMLCACEAIENALSADARACLRQSESQFDKDLLTRSYTKLYKVVTACNNNPDTLLEVLKMLALALGLETVDPKSVTPEFLCGPDKGDQKGQGWVQTALLKLKVLQHVEKLLLAMSDQAWTESVLDWVLPSKFFDKIKKESRDQSIAFADEALMGCLVSDNMPEKCDPLFQVLKGLLQGCYDGDLRQLLAHDNPLDELQNNKETAWQWSFKLRLQPLMRTPRRLLRPVLRPLLCPCGCLLA